MDVAPDSKSAKDPGPVQLDTDERAELDEESRIARIRAKWERLGWTLDADDLFEWKDEMSTGLVSGAVSTSAARH